MKKILSSIKESFKEISKARSIIFRWLFSIDDEDVMSYEVCEILSDPIDKEIYLEALRKLRNMRDGEELLVEFKNRENIILVK